MEEGGSDRRLDSRLRSRNRESEPANVEACRDGRAGWSGEQGHMGNLGRGCHHHRRLPDAAVARRGNSQRRNQ